MLLLLLLLLLWGVAVLARQLGPVGVGVVVL
jgi:hypothetical protein